MSIGQFDNDLKEQLQDQTFKAMILEIPKHSIPPATADYLLKTLRDSSRLLSNMAMNNHVRKNLHAIATSILILERNDAQ